MPPFNSLPSLGKFGKISFGLQTLVGTAVPATMALRYNGQGASPTGNVTRTNDSIADGTVYATRSRTQGQRWVDKSIGFEVEHTNMLFLFAAMFGAPTAGVFTPPNGNFAPLAPGQPLTLEWTYPGFPIVVKDVQISEISITNNQRAVFTGSLTAHGTRFDPLTTPANTAVPNGTVYRYQDHYIRVDLSADGLGGYQTVVPESSSIQIMNPMSPKDGSQGYTPADAPFVVGFERSPGVGISGTFSLPGAQKPFYDLMISNSVVKLIYGMKIGSQLIEFTMPTCEIEAVDPPATLDQIVTPIKFKTASVGGAIPFTILTA